MHIDRKNRQRNRLHFDFSPLWICYSVVFFCLLMVGGRDLPRVHNSYRSCFLVCQLFMVASLKTFFVCCSFSEKLRKWCWCGKGGRGGMWVPLPSPLSVVCALIWKSLHISYTSSSSKVFGGISMVQSFPIGNHQTLDMEGNCIIKRHLLSKWSGFGTNQLSSCN